MGIRDQKRNHSEVKISALTDSLSKSTEIKNLNDLTIFVSGSYARLEASVHSDIDLFFIQQGKLEKLESPNISSMRMFSEVIRVSDSLDFPKFSNDGEFLRILESQKIVDELGGRNDDYENHFTARLLMILESRPVFNPVAYQAVLEEVLQAYFKDYPDHPINFQPTFLVNGILRFWKTLCLNYENKRNQPVSNEEKKLKQKVKNLKLKFSRMLTCYGSISYIAAKKSPIGSQDIMEMIGLTPLERLEFACNATSATLPDLEKAKVLYEWFLEETDVTEAELLSRFGDKAYRTDAFRKADQFGKHIFEIVKTVAEQNNYLRFLIV